AYATPIERVVRLSRPSRSIGNLFNLLQCALERVETDVGFTGISLHVSVFERLSEEQISLLAQEEADAAAELDYLLSRLIARLGEEALRQPRLLESYLPEKAWEGSGKNSGLRTHDSGLSCCRPLQLIAPVEVKVMVSPSDDRDGRPILFRHARDVHELRHTVGPERIAGEWWRGHNKTRDYFDVEDTNGKRFWLF